MSLNQKNRLMNGLHNDLIVYYVFCEEKKLEKKRYKALKRTYLPAEKM